MSKRKSLSLEDDLERLCKKMKKLKKKIAARDESQSVPPNLPPEDDDFEPMEDFVYYEEISQQCEPQMIEDFLSPYSPDVVVQEVTSADPLPDPDGIQVNTVTPEGTRLSETAAPPGEIVTESLDDDVIEILGDDPSSSVKYGPEIRAEIASRFQHIATEGLSKDTRKDLVKKYLLPANCLRVGAPAINLEIKAALNDSILKRDKGIESKQNEMSSAISGLMDVISLQLNSKEKSNTVLQKLMDVGRLLCDIQHGDSVTRRNFVLFAVKSDMQEHLKSTKIDTFLFSEKLSDALKTAKAVNKSGAELKYDNAKNHPKKFKGPLAQSLNRRAAPLARRPPAAAPAAPRSRDHEPATAPRARLPPPPQHATSYKRSSIRPPPQNRRRY